MASAAAAGLVGRRVRSPAPWRRRRRRSEATAAPASGDSSRPGPASCAVHVCSFVWRCLARIYPAADEMRVRADSIRVGALAAVARSRPTAAPVCPRDRLDYCEPEARAARPRPPSARLKRSKAASRSRAGSPAPRRSRVARRGRWTGAPKGERFRPRSEARCRPCCRALGAAAADRRDLEITVRFGHQRAVRLAAAT